MCYNQGMWLDQFWIFKGSGSGESESGVENTFLVL